MESGSCRLTPSAKITTSFLKQISGEKMGKIYKLIGNEVLLGRNPKAHIIMQSLNVSRKHCNFCYTDKGWTVIDKSSSSGVYVGSVRLLPEKPFLLKDGDKIYLGPPYDFTISFVYHTNKSEKQSESCLSEKQKEAGKENEHKLTTQNVENTVSYKDISLRRSSDFIQCSTSKRKIINMIDNPQNNKQRKLFNDHLSQNHLINELEPPISYTSKQVKSEFNANKIITFNEEKASSSTLQTSDMVTPETSSPNLKKYLAAIDHFLSESSKCQAMVRRRIIENERCLNESKNDIDSFEQLENIALNNFVVKNMIEKKKFLEEELNAKNMLLLKLEKELIEKEEILKQIKSTKMEYENMEKNLPKIVDEKIASELEEVLEAGYICSICTEVFIKATALDCSHTFCESCISTWRKKKKQCPICRHKIKNTFKLLVVDSFIERITPKLSPELQERRAKTIKERVDAEKDSKKKTLKRRIKKERNTRSSYRHTETFEDSFETDDDFFDYRSQLSVSNDDDDSSLEGYGYYGGYGRCYNCGRRGHWANGCPET